MSEEDVEISAEMPETCSGDSGRKQRRPECCEHQAITARKENSIQERASLMEAILERENMKVAYERVMSNKGAAGVDGITTEELKDHLKTHWHHIKEELMDGRYKPKPVRQVEIPKPDGGVRKLGIPTTTDRLIQQALHQVLSPIFESNFSESNDCCRRDSEGWPTTASPSVSTARSDGRWLAAGYGPGDRSGMKKRGHVVARGKG